MAASAARRIRLSRLVGLGMLVLGIGLFAWAQVLAGAFVMAAAVTLSYPAISARLWARPPRVLLFVCGGNVGRSPMAAAFARAELAGLPRRTARSWSAHSAGLSVNGTAGRPMAPEAIEALGRFGVVAGPHGSRPITKELCEQGAAIFCMTDGQRQAVLALAPSMRDRTFRLDPDADIPDPAGEAVDAYVDCARHIRQVVRSRLWEFVAARPSTVTAAAAGTGG